MKCVPLYALLSTSVLLFAATVNAWTGSGSSSSSFTRLSSTMTRRPVSFRKNKSMLMYGNDPPNNEGINVFSVLANTERWLSECLSSKNNPFTRKEVSYVCESSEDAGMIVAGIFRRLREAREQGEQHGQTEEERREETGEAFEPRTMRSTSVVVIPSNDELKDSFVTFNGLIESINEARRHARDLVTDVSLEKLDDRMVGEPELEWSVSVNCAHLHPKFGEKTKQQILEEMKQEEESGEVDLNLEEYKKQRLAARRSPYPTVVIEVRSSPPPDFGASPPASSSTAAAAAEEKVTSEDIQKLEALFGRSATFEHPTKEKFPEDREDDFYDALGAAFGFEEIITVTPLILAQNWIAEHDSKFDVLTSTFTVSDAKHVDEGYEFVFLNLAMQATKFQESGEYKPGLRQYLVMGNFLSSSATSLDKFAGEVTKITSNISKLLPGKVTISTLHPEHIDKTKRAPVPVLVWTWE